MSKIDEQATKLAAKPYTVVIFRDSTTDGDHIYVALTPELDGCVAQGETIEEAQENLDAVRVDLIAHLLEHSLPVPEPAWMEATTEGDAIELGKMEQEPAPEDSFDTTITARIS
jgi:predicted RNase H-like HicB family nuclease